MAMDSAATLLFNIKANPDDAVENIGRFRTLFSSDISQLGTQLESWSKEVFGEFETIKSAMLGLTAAAAGAAVAIGAALFELVNKTAETGEQFAQLHEQTGISVETLSALKLIAGETGIGFDTLYRGVEMMDRGLSPFASSGATAAKALKAMGISATDAHGHLLPNITLLSEVADKFSHMKDGADKTAVAMSIFGRSGADMIPILDKGGAAIREATERVKALGLQFTEQSATQSVAFLESFRDVKYAIEGVGVTLGQQLMPTFAAAMKGIAEFVIQNHDDISDFVSGMATTFEMLGKSALFVWDTFEVLGKSVALIAYEAMTAAQVVADAVRGHFGQAKDDAQLMKIAFQQMGTEVTHQFSNLSAHSQSALPDLVALGKAFELQLGAGAGAATQQTDKLAQSLETVKQSIAGLQDGLSKPVAAIEAQYNRQVTAADNAMAAARKAAAAHKLSLDQLSQEEKEYTALITSLGQERSLKLQQLAKQRADKVAQLDQDLENKLQTGADKTFQQKLAKVNAEVEAERAKYAAEDALDAKHQEMLAALRSQGIAAAFEAVSQANAKEEQQFEQKYSRLASISERYYAQSLTGEQKLQYELQQEINSIRQQEAETLKLAKTEQDRAKVVQAAERDIDAARQREHAQLVQLENKTSQWAQEWKNAYAVMSQALGGFSNKWSQFARTMLDGINQQIEAQRRQATEDGVAAKQGSAAIIGALKQQAIVKAIFETAESIAAFARMDFRAGTMHALSAATYGIVAAEQIASLFGGGGGSSAGAGAGAGQAASTSSKPSNSSAAAGASNSPVTQVNIHLAGESFSAKVVATLMQQMNQLSSSGQQILISTHSSVNGAVVPAT